MSLAEKSLDRKNNNFNLIRLILATLVILCHSPELTDGNRHRELVTRLFHTVSFGDLAVDGFFLLSGFLILQSWMGHPKLLDFLKKRVLRIVPAFIAVSLFCALIVGPLAANPAWYFAHFKMWRFVRGMLLLKMPTLPPVFAGTPHPLMNGSMWTIEFEFRCYLLVAVLGLIGMVRRPRLCLAMAAAALALALMPRVTDRIVFRGSNLLLSDPTDGMHLFAFFAAGNCFYLFRDQIRYTRRGALIAAALLLPCMFQNSAAQIGLVICGGYLLFCFAFSQVSLLTPFRTYPDISYGVYLYAWPIQKLVLRHIPTLSPWLLFLVTCVLAGACGLLSWHIVEKPFLRMKPKGNAQAQERKGASDQSLGRLGAPLLNQPMAASRAA